MLPYDRWEGYEAERQRMLRELQSVRNVVFLSTDVHATLVNDARFQTLEPGGPRNSNILDVTVGSAATENYRFEIDRALGQPGTGTLVDTLLRTPSRRAASGCGSIVDQFSYGEVRVTANRLTITAQGDRRRGGAQRRPAVRAVCAAVRALTLSPYLVRESLTVTAKDRRGGRLEASRH